MSFISPGKVSIRSLITLNLGTKDIRVTSIHPLMTGQAGYILGWGHSDCHPSKKQPISILIISEPFGKKVKIMFFDLIITLHGKIVKLILKLRVYMTIRGSIHL